MSGFSVIDALGGMKTNINLAAKGDMGIQGDPGEDGQDGFPGPPGVQGASGAAGLSNAVVATHVAMRI